MFEDAGGSYRKTAWRTARRLMRWAWLALPLLSASCQVHRLTANADAVLWVRTSAEYRAASEQAYHIARTQLERILTTGDTTWTAAMEQTGDYRRLPVAIIVDVDDTVLDTSPFQAYLIASGRRFRPGLWKAWVREQKAAAVPGSLAFIQWVYAQEVEIFYVTNRGFDVETATVRNLEAAGFPVAADGSNVLSRDEKPSWGADKSSRRAFVARNHRVLLIVGDDLNDFISVRPNEPSARLAATKQHRTDWGLKWVIMPNPMYGRWERALYASEKPLSYREIDKRKLDRLRKLP